MEIDSEETQSEEKVTDVKAEKKKGFEISVVARIGLFAATFWAAIETNKRLMSGKLTPEEVLRKQVLIKTLTEKHPLSQFEREFCNVHTLFDEPASFAKDSVGTTLVQHIGTAGKQRIDADQRGNAQKKKEKAAKRAAQADEITKQLLEKTGIEFKPVAAELGIQAQQDSIRANCLKALPDHFAAAKQQLRAFEAILYIYICSV